MNLTVFGILAFLTVLSAGAVVCFPRVLHSALALLACFCLMAVHFLLLGSGFLAVLQLLIYAGAIMVLLVLSVVLFGSAAEGKSETAWWAKLLGALLAGGLLYLLASAVPFSGLTFQGLDEQPISTMLMSDIGQALVERYYLAFELSGVLLLLVTVGAVMLLQEKKLPLPAGRGLRAKQQSRNEGQP